MIDQTRGTYKSNTKLFSISAPLTLGFNPDIVLIGDTVKFICPVVETPPNDRPDQRQVTNVGLTYEVKMLYCQEPDQVQHLRKKFIYYNVACITLPNQISCQDLTRQTIIIAT